MLQSEKFSIIDFGLKIVNGVPFIRQPNKVARRVSDVLAVDWRYETHVKNAVILPLRCVGFLRAGNPFIIPKFFSIQYLHFYAFRKREL